MKKKKSSRGQTDSFVEPEMSGGSSGLKAVNNAMRSPTMSCGVSMPFTYELYCAMSSNYSIGQTETDREKCQLD